MADESKSGFLSDAMQRVAAHADTLRAGAAESLRQKAAEFREAIGPQKTEPGAFPERPFGREEGGEDVKRIVWTGHTVQTPEGRGYFGAAGLTESGYYRAAEVQVYGADEAWRWQAERYTDKADAVASAEAMAANRLQGAISQNGPEPAWREFFEKEQNVALPDHVKAQADAEIAKTGMQKAPVQEMNAEQAVDNYRDQGKELEAMQEQKRQDAVQEKSDPSVQPDRG